MVSREQIRSHILPGERLAMVRFIFSWLVDEAQARGSKQFELTPRQLRRELLLATHFPLVGSLELLQSRGLISLKKEGNEKKVKTFSITLRMELAPKKAKNLA
jgi:hypothetical protein